MSKTFDQGKEEVAKLCQHFTTNRQAFFAPGIKEAHVRQMLIDPFFEALGWDVRSSVMVAPQYREVIPEDKVRRGRVRRTETARLASNRGPREPKETVPGINNMGGVDARFADTLPLVIIIHGLRFSCYGTITPFPLFDREIERWRKKPR